MAVHTGKLAVFDIDGTLHKTEVMSVRAHEIVMREFSLPVPDKETLFSTYGADTETILDILGVPKSRAYRQKFTERIELEERTQLMERAECYDGVLPALYALHASGIQIALCSMCDELYMDAFIRKFSLQEIVAFKRNESAGTDKRLVLKELLEEAGPERAVMVGDRFYDKEAAVYCGIPFIGCLYGYSPQEVEAEPLLVRSGAELRDAVMRVLEN